MIEGYDKMIKEAESYFNSARRGFYNSKKFNEELVFNIITMSVEKFLVGLLMSKGIMPVNHVIKHLLEETEEHFTLNESIKKTLSVIDDYLYICSMDSFTSKIPSKAELEELINATGMLKELAYDKTVYKSN